MSFSKELLKGVAETVVLTTINELGEAYGYELIQAIRNHSKDLFELQEGTLYPILYRLEGKGSVKSTIREAKSGKKRRYYSLTTSGKKLLKKNKQEVAAFMLATKGALSLAAC